ncbi:hypothetical protein EJB05_17392, partial [Eragrostis curvula]
MCCEAGTAARTQGKHSNKNVAEVAAPAALRFVSVTQRDDDKRTVWRRAGVSREGAGEGAPAATATVVTVKIVMSRKDADALVARLNAQSARKRKARLAELKRELRAGGGCGGVRPEAYRDAWKPRLAPILEKVLMSVSTTLRAGDFSYK